MLAVPSQRAEVITYELKQLEKEKRYTISIYQFVKKVPKIIQLVINASGTGGGREVYPLSGLVGTKSGRKVFIELYEQRRAVKPPKVDRAVFQLPDFVRSQGLELVDKKTVMYVKDAARSKVERKRAYFKRISMLVDVEERYCRCVLHVAAKNTRKCNRDLGELGGSRRCYNPYSVCRSRIPAGVVYCGAHYEWESIPTDELIAFADLKKLSVGTNPNRASVLAEIRKEKRKVL